MRDLPLIEIILIVFLAVYIDVNQYSSFDDALNCILLLEVIAIVIEVVLKFVEKKICSFVEKKKLEKYSKSEV